MERFVLALIVALAIWRTLNTTDELKSIKRWYKTTKSMAKILWYGLARVIKVLPYACAVAVGAYLTIGVGLWLYMNAYAPFFRGNNIPPPPIIIRIPLPESPGDGPQFNPPPESNETITRTEL